MNVFYFGNSLKSYLISISIFTGLCVLIVLANHLIIRRLKNLSSKTTNSLDDFLIGVIERALLPVLYFGAFYFSVKRLKFDPTITKMISAIAVVFVTVLVTRLALTIIMYFLKNTMARRRGVATDEIKSKAVFSVIRFGIWSLAVVFMLDNLGFNVSAVVAGLGIGGVAVALAAQTILGDLFNYFVIFFDKPFQEGDFIIIDDYLGTIEHIGIKSTRIRSLGGELLVFSNSDLTGSRIRNYKKMYKRRVVFGLGVTYQTTKDQLVKIPEIIRRIVESVDKADLDRVHFKDYGDFSLNFEIVYYVASPDYNVYMDIQEKINLAIFDAFAAEKIEFAYPTQTLHVSKDT